VPKLTNHRVIMGANIGGIYGAQLFRADDKPHYHRAFSIGCAIIAFGVACAVFRFIIGDIIPRRKDHHHHQQHLEDEDGIGREMRLSSEDIHGHPGHGAAMMRVPTCDTYPDENEDENEMETDGDTDETRVATSSSSYENAEGDGDIDETPRRSNVVVVRESGEQEIIDSAAAYWMLETEIGIAR
jgi:hypothetical protein